MLLCKLPHMKTKGSFIMHISILEAKFVRKKCTLYTGKINKVISKKFASIILKISCFFLKNFKMVVAKRVGML